MSATIIITVVVVGYSKLTSMQLCIHHCHVVMSVCAYFLAYESHKDEVLK